MTKEGLTLLEKAIVVIEHLVSDDLTQDLEFDCAMHPERTPLINDKDAKTFSRKLTAIYTIAHGVNESHSCYQFHDSWRKDIEKRYKRLCKSKEVSHD